MRNFSKRSVTCLVLSIVKFLLGTLQEIWVKDQTRKKNTILQATQFSRHLERQLTPYFHSRQTSFFEIYAHSSITRESHCRLNRMENRGMESVFNGMFDGGAFDDT